MLTVLARDDAIQNSFLKHFIYLFLAVLGRLCSTSFYPAVTSRDYSGLQCEGFSLPWVLLLQNAGSRPAGFRSSAHELNGCGSQALEPGAIVVVHGFVAPPPVGSSPTR